VEAVYKDRVHSGVWVRRDALHAPDDIDRARAAYQQPPRRPLFIDRLRAAFGIDPAGPGADDAQLRKLALAARFEHHDPNRAAMILARLVARQPNDLEAQIGLAQSLDEAARSDEARPVWTRALELSRGTGGTGGQVDRVHAKAAEDRLRGITSEWTDAEQARLMQAGLDALYRDHDPARAVDLLRQVLALNPDHYGASYQLAAALDAAGRRDEARALWPAVLDRANRLGDKKTAADVSARIAARP
jgi:tetratricopeptide (TPR) repeat protein